VGLLGGGGGDAEKEAAILLGKALGEVRLGFPFPSGIVFHRLRMSTWFFFQAHFEFRIIFVHPDVKCAFSKKLESGKAPGRGDCCCDGGDAWPPR